MSNSFQSEAPLGQGLFLGSGKSIQLAGPSILLAYAIMGGVCFLIMRALGELLLSNTSHHSFIDFIAEYLGVKAAFVTGWTYWFCWIAIAMADLTAIGNIYEILVASFTQLVARTDCLNTAHCI